MLVTAAGWATVAARDPAKPFAIENKRIRVEARIDGGRLVERYQARRADAWVDVAEDLDGAATLIGRDFETAGTVTRVQVRGPELVEDFEVAGQRVERKVSLEADGPWVRVSCRLEPAGEMPVRGFVDRFRFALQPDWSFAPSVGGFVPDGQYKAPLILVQTGPVALGIVPDLAVLDRATLQRCNHSLDLDVPAGPILSVGFLPARYAYHSVYEWDRARTWAAAPLTNAYYLLVSATMPPGEAYREAVRFHWRRFGLAEQAEAAAQQAGTDVRFRGLSLWDDWRRRVWREQSRAEWLTVPLPGGTIGGAVATVRWGPGPSVYLSSWFNSLRTSFGMALYARRVGDSALLELAGQTMALALNAPGRDGAFKCIAVPGRSGETTLWAAGDGSGTSTERGFLGYDMSWTAYWLLRWREAGLPGGELVLPRCRALATFLADRQSADGMLPTRFWDDGSVDVGQSQMVKAETGPVALFLLELYSLDGDPRWLAAARRGLSFLGEAVIKPRQWYDYETFWSCSPRQPNLDPKTQQWPANDLALGQTVAAFLAAYRVTHDAAFLERGRALLDYLLLYQQCWTNPVLRGLTGPAMLIGGFTTQNSDAEWSDARQSQFAGVLLDYYRATGNAEYLQRGVAALRAQFPVSPAENWAHIGYGGRAGISSFHWGTGSGLAGIEMEEDYLRDVVVDVSAGVAVGVNGIDVAECGVRDGAINLRLTSPFRWSRPPVAVFHRCDPGRRYSVRIDGVDLGRIRGDALASGITVPGFRP
jgi:hypothetical protein